MSKPLTSSTTFFAGNVGNFTSVKLANIHFMREHLSSVTNNDVNKPVVR